MIILQKSLRTEYMLEFRNYPTAMPLKLLSIFFGYYRQRGRHT